MKHLFVKLVRPQNISVSSCLADLFLATPARHKIEKGWEQSTFWNTTVGQLSIHPLSGFSSVAANVFEWDCLVSLCPEKWLPCLGCVHRSAWFQGTTCAQEGGTRQSLWESMHSLLFFICWLWERKEEDDQRLQTRGLGARCKLTRRSIFLCFEFDPRMRTKTYTPKPFLVNRSSSNLIFYKKCIRAGERNLKDDIPERFLWQWKLGVGVSIFWESRKPAFVGREGGGGRVVVGGGELSFDQIWQLGDGRAWHSAVRMKRRWVLVGEWKRRKDRDWLRMITRVRPWKIILIRSDHSAEERSVWSFQRRKWEWQKEWKLAKISSVVVVE